MQSRLMPMGECWCGCGQETPVGSFFAPGHDQRAQGRVITAEFGGVARFLAAHGYAPGRKHWRAASAGRARDCTLRGEGEAGDPLYAVWAHKL